VAETRPLDLPGGAPQLNAPARSIGAIVLCGGGSTRMGRDKAALPIGAETFLERAIRVAREITTDVIVVARASQPAPPGVRIVHDPIENLGPLAGMAEGLAASTSDLNVVIACDMPLIKSAVLQRLVDAIGDHDACVAMIDGHASVLCGVYRSRVAPVARQLLDEGERRVTALADRIATKRVDAAALRDIDPDLETFFSCDTPEAYRQLRTGSAPRRSPGA
jgi:molybdopterin-guanine dinucleotide biosynthesis protein A